MDALSGRELQPMVTAVGRRQHGVVLVVTLVILVIITLSSIAMMATTRAGASASTNIAFRQAATRTGDLALDAALAQIKSQFDSAAGGLDSNAGTDSSAVFAFRYYANLSSVAPGCSKAATMSPTAAVAAGITQEVCWRLNGAVSQYATPQNAVANGWSDASSVCLQPFTPQTYRFDSAGATLNGSDGAACATRLGSQPSGYTLFYVVHRMSNASGSCALDATNCVSANTTSGICPGGFEVCPSVYYRITVKVVGPRQNNRYIQSFVY